MHSDDMTRWRHHHIFLGADHDRNARRTWIVIVLTATMMIGEIIAGVVFGSMALLADGFHMATHAGALTIAALSYVYMRRHASNPGFTFGTGKFGDLSAYTSAIILGVVAMLIGVESATRFFNPIAIRFEEAIVVAVLGLLVNVLSAWLLFDHHHHDHHQGHNHDDTDHDPHHDDHHHHHQGHDHNLRAAYFHVLADALTSVLAIVGLLAGKSFGWVWMDPAMGIVGACVIAHWAWGLLHQTGAVLLDRVPTTALSEQVRTTLEQNGDRLADLHLWRVGPGHLAAIVAVVSDHPQAPDFYKSRLMAIADFSHVTVEVQRCPHSAAAS